MARRDYGGARATMLLAAETRGPASVAFVNEAMDALEGKADRGKMAARMVTIPDGFLHPESVSPLQESDIMLWLVAADRPDEAVTRLRNLAAQSRYFARLAIADPNLDAIRCRADFRAVVAQLGSGDFRAAKACRTTAAHDP